MNDDEYPLMHWAEERGWWFRGRRRIVAAVLERQGLTAGGNARIADVGCGSGGNLSMLAQYGDVVGVEPSAIAVDLARARTDSDVRVGTAEDTGLPASEFDVVVLLDVLEHIHDHDAALTEVCRVLRPGGLVLLTVPAFDFLWTEHDDVLQHLRRYQTKEVAALIGRSGLDLDLLTYFNATLFPAVAAIRLMRRSKQVSKAPHADGTSRLPAPIDRLLGALFSAERHIVGRTTLPFGVSIMAVAHKP